MERFQSTLPRGERPASGNGYYLFNGDFNPRSREGSDILCPRESFRRWTYFNPRSREGSDMLSVVVYDIPAISIHAPARGATYSKQSSGYSHAYFNPRSREGSDYKEVTVGAKEPQFQSTLPRGERHKNVIEPEI